MKNFKFKVGNRVVTPLGSGVVEKRFDDGSEDYLVLHDNDVIRGLSSPMYGDKKCIGNRYRYLYEENLKLECKFKVGDHVKGIGDRYGVTNKDMTDGIVVDVLYNGMLRIKVLKHKWSKVSDSIYTVSSIYFELIEPSFTTETIKVTYNENKTTVIIKDEGGNEIGVGISKCSPEDDYNKELGFTIAYSRARGLPDISELLKEDDDDLEDPKVEEVEQPKFKVGDIVKVKKDLVSHQQYGTNSFASSMEKYKGENFTIKEIVKVKDGTKEEYKLDGVGVWRWTPEMLELPVKEPIKGTTQFQVGDVVKVKDDLVIGHEYNGCYFQHYMSGDKGKYFVVESQMSPTNNYGLKGAMGYYHPSMLESAPNVMTWGRASTSGKQIRPLDGTLGWFYSYDHVWEIMMLRASGGRINSSKAQKYRNDIFWEVEI